MAAIYRRARHSCKLVGAVPGESIGPGFHREAQILPDAPLEIMAQGTILGRRKANGPVRERGQKLASTPGSSSKMEEMQMFSRKTLSAAALLAALCLPAAAAEIPAPAAAVSGPAAGSNVIPSTAAQKEMMTEGRSVAAGTVQERADLMAALIAAGAPGVEGAPGTESGR